MARRSAGTVTALGFFSSLCACRAFMMSKYFPHLHMRLHLREYRYFSDARPLARVLINTEFAINVRHE